MRVNLSDQTDMMDLLGADLPASGGLAGRFAWSDGPLLQAIRQGHWVLLDELNLAGEPASRLLSCWANMAARQHHLAMWHSLLRQLR